MTPLAATAVATAATVTRVLATPGPWDSDRGVTVSRVIIGGTLTGGMFVVLGSFRYDLARGLAIVMMLTALLVHGVPLAQAANRLVGV